MKLDIQELVQIELHEGVAFSFKPETKTIGVRGKGVSVDRALERIGSRREEAAAILRQRQGIPEEGEEEVERELAVKVPSLTVQKANYVAWFSMHPTIYHPSEGELETMFSVLKEGDLVIADFSHSFTVRRPSGLLVRIDRKGRINPPSPYSPAVRK